MFDVQRYFYQQFEIFRNQLLAEYAKKKTWNNLMIMLIDLKKRVNQKKPFQSLKIEVNDENTINKKNNRRFSKKSKRKKIYIDVQFNLKNDFIYHIDERRRLCISISCEKKSFA